uniref:MOFRL domain-containing protein n=1 Tax=Anopheles epiroticus TaxID=199890 RepID=A0A182P4R1_9DIPT
MIEKTTLKEVNETYNNHLFLLGSNELAVGRIEGEAQSRGLKCIVLSRQVEGNVIDLAAVDLKTEDFIKRAVEGKQEPLLIVGAGEPTVCVSGGGKGGRNQELALRFTYGVRELEHVPDSVCFLSAGTDGIDGPTDVAGALGGSFIARDFEETGQPVAKAKSFIEQNDSYSFYEALGDGQYFVKTGHTGTNVMDVHLLLVPNK